MTRQLPPTARPERIRNAVAPDVPFLPENTFANDVVLVTGGTSGMGLGMAHAFARSGARLVLVGRSEERGRAAVSGLEQSGTKATYVSADVRNAAAVANAFDVAERVFGAVTILANNAGANFPVLAEQISTNAWNAVSRIAIDGTFFASTELARRAIGQGHAAAIVNNSAQYIWTGFPADAHSAAAKTAVATMTRSFARQWRSKNIRVNCVAAGFFPHDATLAGADPERVARIARMIPAGRCGEMPEFGRAAAFLCSPFARAITGQVLMIDGGESLRRSLISPDFVPPNARADLWGYGP